MREFPLVNILIDSEGVMGNDVRREKIDRRTKHSSDDDKIAYYGPERRSGRERRIWVDRTQEIMLKMTQRQN